MSSTKLLGAALTLAAPVIIFLALTHYEANTCNSLLGLARKLVDAGFRWSCDLTSLLKWATVGAFALAAGGWALHLLQAPQQP